MRILFWVAVVLVALAPAPAAHILRVATLADPSTLNPYLSQTDASYDLASLTYSYLIVADDRGRLTGDLATAVPSTENGGISPDGLTYVYRLRRNVRWHDGVPFSAKDVAASWKAVMDPGNNVVDRDGYDRVTSIATPDAYTLVVRLRERYPPFVSRFFAPLQEGAKPVLAAHVLRRVHDFANGELSTSPVGTGPFRLDRWRRGEDVAFSRNDAYFRGKPHLDGVVVRFVPSAQTAAAELASRDVDLLLEPQAALLEQYRSVPDVSVGVAPWNAQLSLLLDCGKPALRDASVRRAIADAIPFGAILRSALNGAAAPARNFLAPTAIGYETLPARRGDVAEAARELDAAGWKAGADGIREREGTRLAFTIATLAGAPMFERIAVLMQSSLRAAGIDASIKPYAYELLDAPDGPIRSGSFDLSLFGSSLNWDPDAYDTLACDRQYPKGANVTRFCDPRIDALERAGLQTDRAPERAAVYRKASVLLWSLLPYVPLTEGRRLVVRSNALRNYRPNPTGTPWWNAWQWEI